MSETQGVLLGLLPGGLWCVWWLFCVDWRKAWPILARGGWAAVLLLMLMVTLVWSRLFPRACDCLGFVTIPNFWWQLGSVSALTVLALFCGWLQGALNLSPPEVSFEPAGHGHDQNDHDHHEPAQHGHHGNGQQGHGH